MTRKYLAIALGLLLFCTPFVKANYPPDEGMWLPLLIKRLNYEDMKKRGCNLTPEEIYSVNKSSVKDAIVQLGGFCTAEVVSDQGLLFTNHHCAYDAIQSHSTVENDYLTDGFWAQNIDDELPVEGLTVKFLVRMEDVTDRILKKVADSDPGDRAMLVDQEIAAIEGEATEGNGYTASVRDMFYGNEYYLFVYKIYRDIRLVGAPPSSIGKFGGDTDNWMWPRHTGDFAVLRIYADGENEPADFSESNKPYKPKHFLPVSTKGLKKGDYSMIMGYPGSTDRYLTSDQIDYTYKYKNPTLIDLMSQRLNIMKEDMDASDEVRIKLASNYASLSNYHKYCVGQNNTLRKRGLQEEKAELEEKFEDWYSKNSDRRTQYSGCVEGIKTSLETNREILNLGNYLNFAGFAPAFVTGNGISMWRLKTVMERSEDDEEAWAGTIASIKGNLDATFEDYVKKTDKKIFEMAIRRMREDLPADYQLELFSGKNWKKKGKAKKGKDEYQNYADYVFEKSILMDKEELSEFLEDPDMKTLEKDPGVEFVVSVIELYRGKYALASAGHDATVTELSRKFVQGIREMMPNKAFYPDANSTMRLTYGTIKPYDPRDGVSYEWFTTTDGIWEKEQPGDKEFEVPQKLLDLIETEDFGPYADKDGKMHVCFLSDNDITGGNSGSPVINGDGHLIGIAFDGNWESMASDLVFDEEIVRTISVDSRYVLFIIDKFAGAQRLIDELKIVK